MADVRKRITVLLVDDHALIRRAFRRVLEDDAAIAVVGETGDGAEAVRLARRLKPSVVVMDCALSNGDGIAATRQIVETCSATAVLMCSMHSEERWVRKAREAGARGYVCKSAVDCDLGAAIRQVASGEEVFTEHPNVRTANPGGGALSARELVVLQLIVNGKTNREIAAELSLSANTVAAHRANIMQALRVNKTADLVVYAIRNGLVKGF